MLEPKFAGSNLRSSVFNVLGTEKPMQDKKQINDPQLLTDLNYERWLEIEKRLNKLRLYPHNNFRITRKCCEYEKVRVNAI
jgi:hypothetical protein